MPPHALLVPKIKINKKKGAFSHFSMFDLKLRNFRSVSEKKIEDI